MKTFLSQSAAVACPCICRIIIIFGILFDFILLFLETLAQAHACGSPAGHLQTPCMRTFVQILRFGFDNCLILFYFVWFEKLTQAPACGRAIDDKFAEDYCLLFCFVVAPARHSPGAATHG